MIDPQLKLSFLFACILAFLLCMVAVICHFFQKEKKPKIDDAYEEIGFMLEKDLDHPIHQKKEEIKNKEDEVTNILKGTQLGAHYEAFKDRSIHNKGFMCGTCERLFTDQFSFESHILDPKNCYLNKLPDPPKEETNIEILMNDMDKLHQKIDANHTQIVNMIKSHSENLTRRLDQKKLINKIEKQIKGLS